MKKLLFLVGIVFTLISCSSSSPTETNNTPTPGNSRLNKIVEVSYNSTGGVNDVSTTSFIYDQQGRLITEIRDIHSPGLDSVIYKYYSGSTLPDKITSKNSYDKNSTIMSLKYDESSKLKSFFFKQYNQAGLYYTDSAAFVYNGNSRPSQVTHFKRHYQDSPSVINPYSLQYFYDGEKLVKSIYPGDVKEFFYTNNLFDKMTHNTTYPDTTLVELVEQGLIKRVVTRNNHDGFLSWDFTYDAKGKITEKLISIDSVLAYKHNYKYGATDLLLNRKYYRYTNNNEFLTEYQYEYTVGATNKSEINKLNRFYLDYSEGYITEFMPWEHPIDLP